MYVYGHVYVCVCVCTCCVCVKVLAYCAAAHVPYAEVLRSKLLSCTADELDSRESKEDLDAYLLMACILFEFRTKPARPAFLSNMLCGKILIAAIVRLRLDVSSENGGAATSSLLERALEYKSELESCDSSSRSECLESVVESELEDGIAGAGGGGALPKLSIADQMNHLPIAQMSRRAVYKTEQYKTVIAHWLVGWLVGWFVVSLFRCLVLWFFGSLVLWFFG